MEERYKLYNGDCLEVMDKLIEEGIKVDTIIIDPPYELDNHGKGKNDFKDRQLVKDNHIEYMSNGFDYENVFEKMLKLNGATTLSNIMRAYVISNTSLSGMPTIVIPLINFVEFFKIREDKK